MTRPRVANGHEVKFDGYRNQLVKEFGRSRIFTRNGYYRPEKYELLVEETSSLDCADAIIDSEVIVFACCTGRTSGSSAA
jgi:ATP-dependent DNA ligase